MKYGAIALVCLIAVAGCGKSEKDKPTKSPDPDNTAVNERDKNGALPTPTDQSSNKADVDRTAEIRKRIMDTELSMDAKNVKVVTVNGRVTLRGPVKTAVEKDTVSRIARDVAGPTNVEDLLEVEPPK